MHDKFKELPFVKKSTNFLSKPKIYVAKLQSDHVCKLPKEAMHLLSTKTSFYEMYMIRDHVLCMQFHPEFNNSAIQWVISSITHSGYKDYLTQSWATTTSQNPVNQTEVVELCANFLKAGEK